MQARGAGGDDSDVGALEAELHGDVAGDHVDDGAGHKKRRDAARAAGDQLDLGFFDQRQAADARANDAADAHSQIFIERVTHRQTTVDHRLTGCGQAVMDEGVHVPGFFFGDVIADLETLDLACDLAGKGRGIKFGNQVNAGLPGQQVGPIFGHRVTHGADTTQTCHYNAATAHAQILEKNSKGRERPFGG